MVILKPCPFCGSSVHLEDVSKNHTGNKGIEYGRIVCDNNNKFDHETRCYTKTVCGVLDKVIIGWNTRTSDEEIKKLHNRLWMDQPWDLISVLKKLTEAADVLLHHYDYDDDGWEEVQIAWETAKKLLPINIDLKTL